MSLLLHTPACQSSLTTTVSHYGTAAQGTTLGNSECGKRARRREAPAPSSATRCRATPSRQADLQQILAEGGPALDELTEGLGRDRVGDARHSRRASTGCTRRAST